MSGGRPAWFYALAVTVALAGIGNIASAWFIHHPERFRLLERVLPIGVIHGSWLVSVVAGAILLFLAYGLWRGKRRAWEIAVWLLLLSSISHVLRGLNAVSALVNLGLALVLARHRSHYRAGSDPVSVKRGILLAVAGFVFVYLYGLLGFYLLDHYFHARFTWRQASGETIALLVYGYAPELQIPGRFAGWFLDSLDVLLSIAAIGGLVLILQPVVYRRTTRLADLLRAQRILLAYGRSAIAYLTVWPDKALFFSPSGRSFLAYRVIGNIAVVLGDPIGPPDDFPAIVERFRTFCGDNDWDPVFYQTLQEFVDEYRRLGFKVLKIGEEGIIDLAAFTLQGGRMKSVRQAVNRARRAGYTAAVLTPPHDTATMAALRAVSDAWLKTQRGGEKRFSLGWFEPSFIRRHAVAVVYDRDGRIVAFANVIPTYRLREGSFDLMRRLPGLEPGVMELLFVQLAEYFRSQGFAGLNLGLAPLSGVGQEPATAMYEKVLRLLYENFNMWYNFKGLRRFKEKFNPRWEPRFLVIPSWGILPRAAVAIIRANAGGSLSGYLKQRGIAAQTMGGLSGTEGDGRQREDGEV